jgi:hypothetical protein
MTVGEVRRHYDAQPFQPFVMHLADGRNLPVARREFLAISPVGRTVLVFQPDESFDIVDLSLVTDLEVGLPPRTGHKRGSQE